ncbi:MULTISPECIES: CHRD domain-containing protein [unclassified Haladaptatus]|uniref:CHRD domain-containing protein n=1 Tax=unclassified Haladaptatus TaxID=2622732 RepID=UPI00209BC316|nr:MULTISPECIES: CHRD domain-containing protein [unclassified Haladaptatus]MCO8244251.1 CHRD domain-containing protein [Haladaptatus sp. AB643]MCO8254123.1 CHRD domain-containing protein [Haladaptatus sp. AB618]
MTHRRDVLKTGATLGVGMGALGTGVGSAQMSGSPSFSTGEITGENQPKNVKTDANGVAMFTQAGENVRYVLLVSKLEDVTEAHIHMGRKGQSGAVVVWLYPSPKATNGQQFSGEFNGVLASGTFDSSDLVGPLKNEPLTQLASVIETGEAYVNVHTKQYPEGEIRGQISPVSNAEAKFKENLDVSTGNGLGIQRSVSLQIQQS